MCKQQSVGPVCSCPLTYNDARASHLRPSTAWLSLADMLEQLHDTDSSCSSSSEQQCSWPHQLVGAGTLAVTSWFILFAS